MSSMLSLNILQYIYIYIYSMRMLKIIARKTAFHRCQTVSRTLMFLYGKLSVKLWLFNAILILERLALNSRDRVVGNS